MIKQLKVKLNNEPGTLREFVSLLAKHQINIKALEITERGDGAHGQVHLIVSNLNKAIEAMKEGGHEHTIEDVIAVEMDDRVGGLAKILDLLASEKINVNYLYAFIGRLQGKSLAVFSVDNVARAQKLLEENSMPLVSQNAIEDDGGEKTPFHVSPNDHFGKDFIW